MLVKLGNRVSNLGYWTFAIGLAFLVVIKNGIHPIGPKWIEIVSTASQSFPDAINYMSTSPMPILILKLLGPNNLLWWSIHTILIAGWTLLVVKGIRSRYPKSEKFAASLYLLSPAWLILILFIGHYDLFTIVGASFAIFARRMPIRLIGVLAAALANPEQSIVTSLLLILLFIVLKKPDLFRIAVAYLIAGLSVFVIVRFILSGESSIERSQIISGELSGVLKTSFGVWSLLPLTLIGISGIVLLLLASSFLKWREFMGVILVVYAIPYLFAFAILDKTRVGVAIAAAPYFYLCKYLLDQLELEEANVVTLQNELLGLVVVVAVLYPTIYFDIDAELRLPYKEFLNTFLS